MRRPPLEVIARGLRLTAAAIALAAVAGGRARGAYLIGYLVAQDLARTASLADLAAMSSATVRPLFDSRLVRLCAGGTL